VILPSYEADDRIDLMAMLQRVVLGQTRFNLPGLAADSRGVVIGRQLVARFAAIDRLVAFLRLLSAEQSIDDLQPGLRIVYARGGAGTREAIVQMPIASPGLADVVAHAARLAGGQTFTGTGKQFVQYRDARAPFGYDVAVLSEAEGDLILHGAEQVVAYRVESELPLAKLLLRLSLVRAERRDPGALVYPARFDFWRNEEAARLLLDDVLPHVPDATLTLVGMSPPEWLRERASEQVHVTGPVPDIRPYLAAAAVMPVPLMAGAGTRLKVLEAFAVGLPVVSTAKGVEGLALQPGEHYVQAETAPEFVAALEQLRAEPARADRLVTDARAWVQEHGSVAALDRAVARALADVTAG